MSDKEREALVMGALHVLPDLERRIAEARIVPDVAGLDVGGAALRLSNGQIVPVQSEKDKPYFVRSATE